MFSQELKSVPSVSNATVNIALDIDDTLAKCFEVAEKEFDEYKFIDWFKKRNLVMNVIKPHILHPGVLEFIQYLFQIPDARISFYSSGKEIRNIPFVQELLTRSLGAERYEKVKNSVSIFSTLEPNKLEHRMKQTGLFFGNKKKELSKILKPGESLSSTVIIDDDPSIIPLDQEKNLLLIPCFGGAYSVFSSLTKVDYKYGGHEINSANHIFYAVGLLKAALNMGRDKLDDNLKALQFGSNDVSYDLIYQNKKYFLDGLQELQKFNPELEFYGGAAVKEFYLESSAKASLALTTPSCSLKP